ncbi:MAG: hypothetical protein BWY35_01301 [Firmicutes bacterium ADurb.Bin248]|nr:MAG: hypothetical protein BWY35_01301 [Firmicutes bacterium ADurb.Bin248]
MDQAVPEPVSAPFIAEPKPSVMVMSSAVRPAMAGENARSILVDVTAPVAPSAVAEVNATAVGGAPVYSVPLALWSFRVMIGPPLAVYAAVTGGSPVSVCAAVVSVPSGR